MTTDKHPLPTEVKWRGSTYVLERVEDGNVFWHNPVSRYHGQCPANAWNRSDPYDGHYQ